MIKTHLFIPVLIAILSLYSCTKKLVGTGNSITKDYSLSDFSSIRLSIDADVNYIYDSIYRVEIHAQENVQDVMKVEVKSGELHIGMKNMINFVKYNPIKVTIHSPHLNGIDISGSGSFHSIGMFESSILETKISGSGDITIDYIKVDNFDIQISGSGSVKINGGESNKFNSRISGSGKLEMPMHKTIEATTNTSGSGKTIIWVEDVLNVTISGSGNVYYKGTPAINMKISGAGKLIKL